MRYPQAALPRHTLALLFVFLRLQHRQVCVTNILVIISLIPFIHGI